MPEAQTPVHTAEDALELFARGRLEPGHTSTVESHLLECKMCRDSLADSLGRSLALHLTQGTKSEATHERSEPRFSTEGEATLQELHPLSLDRHKVKIANVSKNGLGIVSPKAILPGTIVQLRIQDTVELGNVRYCAASDTDGFRIGLRLHGEG
jgi:hypothetical protein